MAGVDFNVDASVRSQPITPAWKVLGRGSRKVDGVVPLITWFQETLPLLEDYSKDRIETMVNNLLWYTGEYDKSLEYRIVAPGQAEKNLPRRVLPRIFNHLYDITEQRVAKLSRYKPSFEVVPTNREENDRLVSRLMKTCLDATARRVHVDFLMQELERWTAVFGECYFGIEWDKNIGDRVKARSLERIGDVSIYIKAPWTVLPEPKRNWADVNWLIDIYEIIHIDEARKKYGKPSLAPDGKRNIFSFNADVQEKREDEVVIYRIIHKPNEYLPEGNVTTLTHDTILNESDKYPYSHFDFPFERHTDIDVPGRLFPMSFYQHIKPIQHVYNKLTSMITRNILLTAHPKVLMPKGAAKIEAFSNAPTVIEYAGPIAPEVLTFNSVPAEMFQFRDAVKMELGQVSGIQGVSRGAPPPGARAASMLRFYEEQEEQRASTQIIKHNEMIRRTFLKAAGVIGDYYPAGSKDRLIRVVGKENQYQIEAFQGAKISSEYDVIIINSTGFSESMAGRLEEIQLLQQYAPGILSPDQIADVLELKNPQKAYDISTSAIKHAEEENQRFLDGKDVPPPKKYQDLIVHWRTHMIMMNSSTWENSTPEGIKRSMEDHILATEYLMEEKAVQNVAFAQLLQALPGYPAFWTPTPQPAPQAQVSAPSSEGATVPTPMGAPGLPSPTGDGAILPGDQDQMIAGITQLAQQIPSALDGMDMEGADVNQ